MRSASLNERAEVAIKVDTLDDPSERTKRCPITNEIRHNRGVTATREYVPMPEARERSGGLLVFERSRSIEVPDLRRQSLTYAELRGLPRDDISGAE